MNEHAHALELLTIAVALLVAVLLLASERSHVIPGWRHARLIERLSK
jgi:hypothetical protein